MNLNLLIFGSLQMALAGIPHWGWKCILGASIRIILLDIEVVSWVVLECGIVHGLSPPPRSARLPHHR